MANTKDKVNNNNVAIKVENLSKTFKIPHEKESTMKGAVVNLLNSAAKGSEIFKALEDINFEVKKGEFFGIIGRNGCGKSTLLKILAGIYVPDKGKSEIAINGKLSPFLELGVGFNPELTGRENIFLGGTILGLTKKQIAERYNRIVAFSELNEFIDMKMKNYSSGMQVRLAFSLAINVEAEILLMDEVLAVGDTNFQSKCLAEFNKYRELGKTVILVTHDIGVVQRYCDRAMLLRNGQIVMIGDSDEVGNEYMHQNMADEEVRIDDDLNPEEDKPQETKLGTSKAELIKMEFLDKNGKKKNVFQTGEDLTIKVSYKINKKLDFINFGIGIFNQEGNYASGANTINDKIDTKKYLSKGSFQVEYKNIPLRIDSYYVACAIYGENETVAYDYIPKMGAFKIFSEDKKFGMFLLDSSWE